MFGVVIWLNIFNALLPRSYLCQKGLNEQHWKNNDGIKSATKCAQKQP